MRPRHASQWINFLFLKVSLQFPCSFLAKNFYYLFLLYTIMIGLVDYESVLRIIHSNGILADYGLPIIPFELKNHNGNTYLLSKKLSDSGLHDATAYFRRSDNDYGIGLNFVTLPIKKIPDTDYIKREIKRNNFVISYGNSMGFPGFEGRIMKVSKNYAGRQVDTDHVVSSDLSCLLHLCDEVNGLVRFLDNNFEELKGVNFLVTSPEQNISRVNSMPVSMRTVYGDTVIFSESTK